MFSIVILLLKMKTLAKVTAMTLQIMDHLSSTNIVRCPAVMLLTYQRCPQYNNMLCGSAVLWTNSYRCHCSSKVVLNISSTSYRASKVLI